MSRRAFHDLLQKYLAGNCTEEEKLLVDEWYKMLDKKDLPTIQEQELEEIEDRLWSKVVSQTSASEESPQVRRIKNWRVISIAAAVSGLLILGGYFLFTNNLSSFDNNELANEYLKKENTSQNLLEVIFEDGSKATLQPGATISYLRNFTSQKREVVIEGEVFFEVEKDKRRPFFVISNDLVTKVVGTSFIVKNDESTRVSEVVVISGKVLVAEKSENNDSQALFEDEDTNVVLTPNQRVVFRKELKEMVKTLAERPLPISDEKEKVEEPEINFVFNDENLSSVFTSLEVNYGIEIISVNKSIHTCTFTGDLNDQNLYTNLDFVCQSIGATYEVKETKIFINGGNCN